MELGIVEKTRSRRRDDRSVYEKEGTEDIEVLKLRAQLKRRLRSKQKRKRKGSIAAPDQAPPLWGKGEKKKTPTGETS